MRRIWELQPPPGSLLSNTLKDIPLVGLVMLAWPAGSGKTGMLLKLAYRYAAAKPALFFTLDQTAEDLAARLYGAYPAGEVARRQLTICDDQYTIEEMDALAGSGEYGLVLIDDLELAGSGKELSRWEEREHIWEFLRRWSQDCLVIAAMRQPPLL